MNSKIKGTNNEKTERLWRAVLSLRDRDECERFFSDLCTVAEIEEMSKRLDVAVCIDGGMSYGDAAVATGASTATISRVKRALYYGSDGYSTVIERLAANAVGGEEGQSGNGESESEGDGEGK